MLHFYSLQIKEDETEVLSFRDVNIVDYLAGFFRETTLQGVTGIAKNRCIVKKLFWLLAVIASGYALYWELGVFFTKFLSFQASTSVSFESAKQLDVPAITVCNNNPVTADWSEAQGLLNTASSSSLSGILEAASSLPYQNRSRAGHRLVDVIFSCEFDGGDCNVYSNLSTWHWSSTYGSCWTFNFGYRKASSTLKDSSATLWELKRGINGTGIKSVTQAGDSHGLYLLLYTDSGRYLTSTQDAGWRILVHNQTEMPFPDEEGLFVMPGVSTRIGVKLRRYSRLGLVDNGLYVANYSNCVSDADRYSATKYANMYSSFLEVGYSRKACLKTCYSLNVVSTCKCFDFNYPYDSSSSSSSVPVCSSNNTALWNCRKAIWKKYTQNELDCFCPDSCESYMYTTSLSALKWPIADRKVVPTVCTELYSLFRTIQTSNSSDYADSLIATDGSSSGSLSLSKSLNVCISHAQDVAGGPVVYDWSSVASELIGSDFGEVYVYVESFEYEMFTEEELIEVGDLIAYLGGIIGLFFGFTMLTLCEYLLLLVDLVVAGFAKLYYMCQGQSAVGNGAPHHHFGSHYHHHALNRRQSLPPPYISPAGLIMPPLSHHAPQKLYPAGTTSAIIRSVTVGK